MSLLKNHKSEIPLIQFTDLDRDGMMDFVFYFNRAIYVFYNKQTAKRFDSASIEDSQNLCFAGSEVENRTDIFSDANDLTNKQANGLGHFNITRQDLDLTLKNAKILIEDE